MRHRNKSLETDKKKFKEFTGKTIQNVDVTCNEIFFDCGDIALYISNDEVSIMKKGTHKEKSEDVFLN